MSCTFSDCFFNYIPSYGTHMYYFICILGVFKKLMPFYKRIPVQVSSHFVSMFLNRSKFDVFIFTHMEMPFTGREKVFCVLEYARSQPSKTVQHAFVREFSKQSPTAM